MTDARPALVPSRVPDDACADTVLWVGDIRAVRVAPGPGVLALAHPDVVLGAQRLHDGWWWTPVPEGCDAAVGLAWSLARVPGAETVVATTGVGASVAAGFGQRLAAARRRRWTLPHAPALSTAPPTPPPELIRVPHLVTTPTGCVVVWEVLPPAAARRLFDQLLVPADLRAAVEGSLPLLVQIRDALDTGWRPTGDSQAARLLADWAQHGHRLDTALIYRYWPRLAPALPALAPPTPATGGRHLALVCAS
ncbi:hypothetical protein PT931_20450 [Longispora urticae]